MIAMLKMFEVVWGWVNRNQDDEAMDSQPGFFLLIGLEWSLTGPNLLTVAWKYKDSKQQFPDGGIRPNREVVYQTIC